MVRVIVHLPWVSVLNQDARTETNHESHEVLYNYAIIWERSQCLCCDCERGSILGSDGSYPSYCLRGRSLHCKIADSRLNWAVGAANPARKFAHSLEFLEDTQDHYHSSQFPDELGQKYRQSRSRSAFQVLGTAKMKMYYDVTYPFAVPMLFKHVQSFLLNGCGQGIFVDILRILSRVIGPGKL